MLVFEERGNWSTRRKPLGAEKRREPTNSTHIWHWIWESNPGPHWWEASALTTAPSLHPHMGYIGTCHGIGYVFWGSRSLNRVSFFTLFILCLMPLHPMLQSRNKIFLFMLIIVLFFHWIGCHFSALGLRKGISFRFLSP